MPRSATRAAILCVIALLGCFGALAWDGASANERIVVLRGDHCPDWISAISAQEALKLADAACILLDPVARARLGPPGSAIVPAQTCGERAAEINSVGAVLCVQQEPGPPRGARRAFPQGAEQVQGSHHGIRRPTAAGKLVIIVGLLVMWARWAVLLLRFLRPRRIRRSTNWPYKSLSMNSQIFFLCFIFVALTIFSVFLLIQMYL